MKRTLVVSVVWAGQLWLVQEGRHGAEAGRRQARTCDGAAAAAPHAFHVITAEVTVQIALSLTRLQL